MYIKISEIEIQNMNLLSCPYTLGLSLSAVKGFVDKINLKDGNDISFVVIINSIKDKKRESISRDTKYVKKVKGDLKMPPLLPIKYFDANLDIILHYKENEESDITVTFEDLEKEINISKLQGGNIIDFKLKKYDTMMEAISDSNDLSKIIVSRQNLLTNSTDLIQDVAEKLYENEGFCLLSNGYISLEEYDFKRIISISSNEEDDIEIDTKIVEPNLILAKQISVYEFINNELERENFEFYESDNTTHFLLETK